MSYTRMHDLIAQMLAPLDRRSWTIQHRDNVGKVILGEAEIAFDRADHDLGFAFERLADVVGATIALRPAQQMIEAAAGLQESEGSNARRRLAEIASHPFFAAAEMNVVSITQDGSALVIEVDHR